jgi:hypothetical protein
MHVTLLLMQGDYSVILVLQWRSVSVNAESPKPEVGTKEHQYYTSSFKRHMLSLHLNLQYETICPYLPLHCFRCVT